MASNISDEWRKVLAIMSAQQWQGYVIRYTPSHVQNLLSSQSAPTIFTLEALGSTEPLSGRSAVVFACILTPRRIKFLESECLLYIGSTVDHYFSKIYSWQFMTNQRGIFWPNFRSDKRRFSLMCNPIPLFEVPYAGKTTKEQPRNAALVGIAEAVYTIWLQAVAPEMKPAIKGMVPWDGEYIRYQGTLESMPLRKAPDKVVLRATNRWRRPRIDNIVRRCAGGDDC